MSESCQCRGSRYPGESWEEADQPSVIISHGEEGKLSPGR